MIADQLGLSDEQRAVLAEEGSVLVRAGAGAGKTTTLAALVVRDLAAGVAPEQICVCTFTRAAAMMLAARIERTAVRAGVDVASSGMWIGTIDALLGRIVREDALAAGLSPGVRVLGEAEQSAMASEAVRVALRGCGPEQLIALESVWPALEPEAIAPDLLRWYERTRLADASPHPPAAPRPDPTPALVRVNALLARDDLSASARGRLERNQAALSADDISAWTQIGTPGGWGTLKKHQRADGSAASAAIHDYLTALRAHAAAQAQRAAHELLADFVRAYDRAREAHECLDFPDLVVHTRRLASSGDLTRRFARLYLDEAQDTNPPQVAVLTALCDGALIAVGDPVQSIYSFRGADVRAISALAGRLGAECALTDTYRADPALVSALAPLLGALPACPERPMPQRARRPAGSARGPRLVGVVVPSERTPPLGEELACGWAQVEEVRTRLGLDWGDVAVLVRTNGEVREAATWLGRRGYRVSLRGESRGPEVEDVLAALALIADRDDRRALMRVLTSPLIGCDLETAGHIVRDADPWARHDWPATRWEALAHRARTEGPAALARAVIVAHDYAALCAAGEDPTAADRLEQLTRRLAALEADGHDLPGALAALSRDRGARLEESPEAGAVRVMTIHQSKGEEYPLVILPGLGHSRPAHTDRVVFTDEGALGLRGVWGDDPVAELVKQQDAQRTQMESWRLLYVALTRAAEALVLIGHAIPGEEALAPRGALRWLTETAWQGVAIPAPGACCDAPAGAQLICADPTGTRAPTRAPTRAQSVPLPDLPPRLLLDLGVAGEVSFTDLTAARECRLRDQLTREWRLPASAHTLARSTGARELGVAVHDALAAHFAPTGVDIEHDPHIRAHLDAALGGPWMTQIAAGHAVWAERRFATRVGERVVLGVMDLLVAHAEGGALIIDWKTGETEHQDDWALQQRLYAHALLADSRHRGPVECQWVSLPEGEVHTARFDPAEAPELATHLAEEIEAILGAPALPGTPVLAPMCHACPGLTGPCARAADLDAD